MSPILDFVVLIRRAVLLDRLRLSSGPKQAVLVARGLGERTRCRSERSRRTLHRMISLVDRLWWGGPNCYRRVLLEVAMDRGAAGEIVQLGFRSSGTFGSGHAWLGAGLVSDGKSQPYDAIVSI
ncbi:MAG TPA: hypothetical protein VGP07_17035 [Polyangia bacterium]